MVVHGVRGGPVERRGGCVSTTPIPVEKKLCDSCGIRPIAKGARRYCIECKGVAAKDVAKAAARKPCNRCGGPKGNGRPGQRYCPPCREVTKSSAAQYEAERQRVRAAAKQAADREEALLAGRGIRRRNDAPEGQKWCARCQRFLPLASFAQGPSRPATYCVPCQRSYNHEHRLKSVYGIDAERYGEMYDQQGGRCAICLRRPRTRRLAVDHNHTTNEIRGLLCSRCNKHVLGYAMESISLLRRAANYLERPPARTGEPLEKLDHMDEMADTLFTDELLSIGHGDLAIDPSGEYAAVTYKSFVALAQAAGVAMVHGDNSLALEMGVDDADLVKSLWRQYCSQVDPSRTTPETVTTNTEDGHAG